MTRQGWIIFIMAAGLLAGCAAATPGRSRELGDVVYGNAFAAARDVVSQYYSIESADPDKGIIKSRPLGVDEKGERILGGNSPARQLATLTLRRKNGQIVAHASVAVQRQGSAMLRQMRTTSGEDYSSVPNQTPAEIEAATTPEQNESWITQRYAHDVENKILDDIYRALHPSP